MANSYNYYYIFGVRQISTKELKLKLIVDFIIDYTPKDIENAEMAKNMVENKIFSTTESEAIDSNNLNELSHNLTAMRLRCRMNNISVHKIKTEYPMEPEDIEMFVAAAEYSEDTRKKLNEARINL